MDGPSRPELPHQYSAAGQQSRDAHRLCSPAGDCRWKQTGRGFPQVRIQSRLDHALQKHEVGRTPYWVLTAAARTPPEKSQANFAIYLSAEIWVLF
jgi:hypothetical protein